MTSTKMQRARGATRLISILSSVVGLAVPSACASHVPSGIAYCPCAAGNVCCESGVCAVEKDACAAATVALSQSAQGVWAGYFENFKTEDDALRIAIAVASDGKLSGEIVVGTGPPPPPATNPDIAWPSPIAAPMAGPYDSWSPPVSPWNFPEPSPLMPGFVYHAENIRWEGQRLKFTYSTYEPWHPWCELQQSFSRPDGTFSCVPEAPFRRPLFCGFPDLPGGDVPCPMGPQVGDSDGQGNCIASVSPPTTVPCYKFVYCDAVCSCAANHCAARQDVCDETGCVHVGTGLSAIFDIALRDGVGDGTGYLGFDGSFNIRLAKSP